MSDSLAIPDTDEVEEKGRTREQVQVHSTNFQLKVSAHRLAIEVEIQNYRPRGLEQLKFRRRTSLKSFLNTNSTPTPVKMNPATEGEDKSRRFPCFR